VKDLVFVTSRELFPFVAPYVHFPVALLDGTLPVDKVRRIEEFSIFMFTIAASKLELETLDIHEKSILS
jgi:hypothetical protein